MSDALLTLDNCRNDRGILAIAGVSPNSDEFSDLINNSARKALRRGDWDGTVVPIHVCVKGGCIVWPRYVGHVRKLNLCKYNPVPINNLWYDFLPRENCDHWMQWIGGVWNPTWQPRMVGQGYSPTHTGVMGEGRYIRAYHQLASDVGKTIRIFGLDNNGQPLRETIGGGVWQDGITLRFAVPYAQSLTYVRQIDRVIKDETQGNITLFAYNVADAVLEDLATYEPSETNPAYERYQLNIPNCTTGTCTTKSVIALVKLKFIPARFGSDLVYIQNLDALKLLIQSIKSGEAGDRQSAIGYEQDAIRELNLDLFNRDQDEQVPVSNDPFAGTGIGSQRCF